MRNLSIKKPCSRLGEQGVVVVNTGVLTLKSMKQTADQVKLYDAGDMTDAHALAQSHLKWLARLVCTIKLNADCNRVSENKELLEITHYLAESFAEDHRNKSDQYEIEWKA